MANSIAYLALTIWPVVVLVLMSRVGIVKGGFLAIILSYLLLPASFEINFPGIPAFNKGSVTSISIFLYLLFKNKGFGLRDFGNKEKILLLLMVVSPFLTAITNAERYLHLPGMSFYDGISQTVGALLAFFPFFFGFKYFRSKESHILVLRYFVLVVLFYSVLILYEIRMSPQLHTMLYGYFPHSFIQQVRAGGFRAVVFLGHGLLVALLVSVAFLISVVLWRLRIKISNIFSYSGLVVIFLFVLLVLSKSYGALIIGIIGFIALRFFSHKIIFLISYSFIAVYFFYPVMSATDIFPHDVIVNAVSNINSDRAQSLQFRFFHEGQLLAHANEKSLLGWGSWGRNRVYDPETFQDLSVTDGRWIILLGSRGWIGFLSEFMFIALSIFYASKAVNILQRDRFRKDEALLLSAHALIVSLILIDQIPNSSFNYFYWFFLGVLYGRSCCIIANRKINKDFN